MLRQLFPALLLLIACGDALAESPVVISQKGKVFAPGEITVPVGTTVEIKNDDRVLHHVYIEQPDFNFDSGEQPPGKNVRIRFDKNGMFEVRCDIHPKMLLRVRVE